MELYFYPVFRDQQIFEESLMFRFKVRISSSEVFSIKL